jgi:hypothetical protein
LKVWASSSPDSSNAETDKISFAISFIGLGHWLERHLASNLAVSLRLSEMSRTIAPARSSA